MLAQAWRCKPVSPVTGSKPGTSTFYFSLINPWVAKAGAPVGCMSQVASRQLCHRWTQNWHQPVLTIPLPHPAFVHDPLPAPPSALEGIRNLPRAPGALWVMLEQHSRLPLLPGTGRKPWTESSGLPELTIWADPRGAQISVLSSRE